MKLFIEAPETPHGCVMFGDNERGAFMSTDDDGLDGGPLYRYALWRRWDDGAGVCLWVMLNPSTADHEKDDPTMKRVIHFSKSWGFHGCAVVNLFALRSSSPAALGRSSDPMGPLNGTFVSLSMHHTTETVAAWGDTKYTSSADGMKRLLLSAGRPILCLGTNSNGSPMHPMARGRKRIPNNQQPIVWRTSREGSGYHEG